MRLTLALREAFSATNGIPPAGTPDKVVENEVAKVYERYGWGKSPKRDTINRATGRRKN
ncbi:hypothetical protein HAP47_0001505 [Bradyrhizobium sp. 41S5]|uniref:hypothetical protein n=1 Tax=Bradyrhizobium sp. 41S5 TaxID=1404443 RepID=UPI00156AE081|nr:hypothetical protein [Bradyrhizobium sp. 41S5]UFX45436.1 hypothetical protein HAP47_0001505 [Bradyrhizobium sp. 41S5]